ncbi:MAG: hypothetical protein ACP5JO_02105 [Candidatus Ratteibacteria bacterium]
MERRIEIWCMAGIVLPMFLFLSGCASTQRQKVEVEKKSPAQQEIQLEAKTMITTGTRTMPDYCNAGDTIRVKIDIVPASQTSGIIITEKLPDGWKIVNSEPPFTKVMPDNSYKWLQWARALTPFTVNYELKIPESAKGSYILTGILTTYREGDIEIIGKKEIVVK